MKRRFGLILLTLVGLAVAAFLVFQYADWQQRKSRDPKAKFIKPRVHFRAYNIKNIRPEGTAVTMTLLIENPSPLGVRVDSARYTLHIAGVEVMHGMRKLSANINPNDTTYVNLPATLDNDAAERVLRAIKKAHADSTNYRIVMDLYTDNELNGNKPIRYDDTLYAPSFILPEVKVLRIDPEKLGLKNTRFNMTSEVTNENVYPFKFRNMRYQIEIDGDTLAEGNVDSAVLIPPKGTTTVVTPVELKPGKAVETLYGLVVKPADTKYRYRVDVQAWSNNPSVSNSSVTFNATGNLKDLKRAYKDAKRNDEPPAKPK